MMGVNALELGYLDFDHPVPTDLRSTAERCIACGACAANCPNEAMIVGDKDGERCVSLCGTVLNRLKLEYCEKCGVPVGPARYHDYVMKRIKTVGPTAGGLTLCVACARKFAAERHSEISPPASERKQAE